MTEILDDFDPMPTPLHVVTRYTTYEAERSLKMMSTIAIDIMSSLPWRAQSAIKHFMTSTYPPLRDLDMHTTYQVDETHRNGVMAEPLIHTLLDVFRDIIKFNRPPSTYNVASPFYRIDHNVKTILPRDTQLSITQALNGIEAFEHFTQELNQFWQTPHPFTALTNRDIFAKMLATTLQCEAILRLSDQSLSLNSVALLTKLASPQSLELCHLYTVSLIDESAKAHIPLVGAFVISQHPEHELLDNNPCVFHVPGSTVREFESPQLLKTLLSSDLNLTRHRHLLSCLPLNRRHRVEQLAKQGFSARYIMLTPIAYSSTHFYNEQIQRLIEKQRDDIQHAWSSANQHQKQIAYWPDELIRQAGNIMPLLSSPDLLKLHAPAARAIETPITYPTVSPTRPVRSSTLKIHVYIHHELVGRHSTKILEESYFSWVLQEIARLTHRDVEIMFNPPGTPSAVFNYDYKKTGNAFQALMDWKALLKEHLSKTNLGNTPLHLFLLLTRHSIDDTTLGMAEAIGGQFAIASITKYKVPGHEIGHLLGANHEDGAIIYNGWWHDSVMRSSDFFSPIRGQAYRFSDHNRLNIRNYLHRLP